MSADRSLLDAFRRLVAAFTSRTRYLGTYAYRVVRVNADLLELSPVRPQRTGLPDLTGVPMRPGIPGARGVPVEGSLVLVQFIDGEPTEPYVAAFVGADSPDHVPEELEIDASDTVTVGASAGRVHVGGAEPYDAPSSQGRFVRYGDTIVFSSPGPGPVVIAGGTMSKAGT